MLLWLAAVMAHSQQAAKPVCGHSSTVALLYTLAWHQALQREGSILEGAGAPIRPVLPCRFVLQITWSGVAVSQGRRAASHSDEAPRQGKEKRSGAGLLKALLACQRACTHQFSGVDSDRAGAGTPAVEVPHGAMSELCGQYKQYWLALAGKLLPDVWLPGLCDLQTLPDIHAWADLEHWRELRSLRAELSQEA